MLAITKKQEELIKLFQRNGVIRVPNKERLKEGYNHYKKGYELRWTAVNKEEELFILNTLGKLGLKAGKPFKKVNRTIIPVWIRIVNAV